MRKNKILCFISNLYHGPRFIPIRSIPLIPSTPRDPPSLLLCVTMILLGVYLEFPVAGHASVSPSHSQNVQAITQFLVRTWTPLQGLPQSSIHDILQDPRGYLWLTTQNGLVRFDGIAFSVVPVSPDPEDQFLFFTALTLDSRGRLWAGTYGHGVFFQNQDGWHHLKINEILTFAIINVLRFDHQGTLWIGTQNHGIYRVDVHHFQVLHIGNKKRGLTNPDVRTILERKNGSILVGTSQGIFRFTGSGWHLNDVSGRLP